MSEHQEILKRQQSVAQAKHDRMLAILMDYNPCRVLTVADVKFLAEMVRTLSFEAMQEIGS